MQFLRLIFVKKLQGALPPDPHWGRCPLDPHWGPSAVPPAPTFQLTFPFLIPMPEGLCQVNVERWAVGNPVPRCIAFHRGLRVS